MGNRATGLVKRGTTKETTQGRDVQLEHIAQVPKQRIA